MCQISCAVHVIFSCIFTVLLEIWCAGSHFMCSTCHILVIFTVKQGMWCAGSNFRQANEISDEHNIIILCS